MTNRFHYQARVAAIWLLHGECCAKLLRAHGRDSQADSFETGLSELTELIAAEVGRQELADAMIWAHDQIMASNDDEPRTSQSRH